jgi:uncharacterized protein (DUF885 family)
MIRVLKWVGLLVLVVLLAAGALVAHTWYAKPLSINWFFEKVFVKYALDNPELLTSLRLFEQVGINGHNARLADASMARETKEREFLKANLATLRSYDRSALAPSEQISYDILEYFLDVQARGEAFAYHNYPVNQMFGVQSSLPKFLADTHQIHSREDADNYLARLSAVPTKFAQVLEGLRHRQAQGILPLKFLSAKVLSEMQAFAATPADGGILYTSLVERLDKLPPGTLDLSERQALLDDAKRRIETEVYPAYQQFIGYFQSLDPNALNDSGAWALPNGDAFYRWAIEMHTTTTMAPDALHALGVNEVARIQAEADEILRAAGLTEGTVAERIATLAKDPAQLYPDSDAGRAQILADYQKIIDEIAVGLDAVFDVRPKVGVEVRRVPEFSEKTSAGAYYNAPALDGSRPGVFYANLRDVNEIPRFGMRTLAYHEAIPGHHFQLAIMQQLKGVPMFRRLLPFTAYSEGWALYTEQLAWELGFQKNPLDNLGRLQAELFRAVRLVVDTGLHHQRWTREQAIDYMRSNTGMGEKEVTAEIERYLVMPGQALAYKVGMLKILQLRDRAKAELGAKFDLREFHNVVLTGGAMPMKLLERSVDGWIARKLAPTAMSLGAEPIIGVMAQG